VGRNIDMTYMFGDFSVTCPSCNHTESAESYGLDDVDVDGSEFNPKPGIWEIKNWCNKCEVEFIMRLKITVEQTLILQEEVSE